MILRTLAVTLAWGTAAAAQELPRFPAEDFGKAVLSRDQAITGGISYEAFIGQRNIEFLAGYGANSIFRQVGRAVGRLDVLTDAGVFPCTAFLVSGNRLVTNFHCVPGVTEDTRTGARAIFAVEFRAGFLTDGLEGEDTVFRVSPQPLESDAALDYSVLQIMGDANAEFGALELSAALPQDRDPFWVIGHPDARALQISREKCQAAAPALNAGRAAPHLRHAAGQFRLSGDRRGLAPGGGAAPCRGGGREPRGADGRYPRGQFGAGGGCGGGRPGHRRHRHAADGRGNGRAQGGARPSAGRGRGPLGGAGGSTAPVGGTGRAARRARADGRPRGRDRLPDRAGPARGHAARRRCR
jgi:hypothetical protein